ncbi:unnamed protein product, partial [Iphiclides podalirius]
MLEIKETLTTMHIPCEPNRETDCVHNRFEVPTYLRSPRSNTNEVNKRSPGKHQLSNRKRIIKNRPTQSNVLRLCEPAIGR